MGMFRRERVQGVIDDNDDIARGGMILDRVSGVGVGHSHV
jgi:hypothetical protein